MYAISNKRRNLVYLKCGNKCFYCPKTLEEMRLDDSETIDHLTPKNKGGGNNIENLALSCRSCNSKKGTTLHEHYIKILEIKDTPRYKSYEIERDYFRDVFNALKNSETN